MRTNQSGQIVLENIGRDYITGSRRFAALSGVSIDIGAGECVAVVGKSGSGKTTLTNLLTGIDSPSTGTIYIGGNPIHSMSQNALTAWRGRHVGVIFQFFQLLPTLTVAENVMLPMDFCATFARAERRPRAMALLERLGIADQADKLPADLSGGQQQRAAIARALANDPPILVADEPTGNLDSATADDVMSLLAALAKEGRTLIIVTHEHDFARFFTRTITLCDGIITSDVQSPRANK
ncbi:ABC transporter ATP-binding protein [Massilia eurypsychrophila]|jgi:putative ABC transport system ATP-binding protein|uniref:ABC transporter ATP-binding protein n=1 Tax=Massilia eurypsychrophila TaxID=1485217 RepID=A0A2G8TD63_9BURK|nr:ABC transporter ATP-binding protein [Massilia eurypsychrophila]PIL43598.1 ABC transporter ATP-binding protein [Massilia eurypsychrophila]